MALSAAYSFFYDRGSAVGHPSAALVAPPSFSALRLLDSLTPRSGTVLRMPLPHCYARLRLSAARRACLKVRSCPPCPPVAAHVPRFLRAPTLRSRTCILVSLRFVALAPPLRPGAALPSLPPFFYPTSKLVLSPNIGIFYVLIYYFFELVLPGALVIGPALSIFFDTRCVVDSSVLPRLSRSASTHVLPTRSTMSGRILA